MPIPDMDPVEVLISRYSEFEKQGTSLREFSRFLEIHPSTLSKILARKRGIPKALATKFASKLLSSEEEQHEFVESVLAFQLESSGLKTEAPRVIVPDESLDSFLIISQWEFFAILNVIGLKKFDHSYDFIAESLGISIKRVVECINILKRNHFIEVKNNKIIRKQQKLETTDDVASRALRMAHLEELDLAKAKIEVPLDRRYYRSTVAKVSKKDFLKVKKLIDKLILDLDKVTDDPDAEDVYLLTTQFFPLTRKVSHKKGLKKNEH